MRPKGNTLGTVTIECAHCGTPVSVYRSDAWKRRYCTRSCTKAAKIAASPARFWEQVEQGEPNECWPWIGRGSYNTGRYGRVYFHGKFESTHRVAFFLTRPR